MHRHLSSFIILCVTAFALPLFLFASTTDGTIISGTDIGYAWSDQIGWINFGATNGNITITDTGLSGYAWSDHSGWINLAPTQGGVSVDSDGTLSGYAWGAGVGWVNFSGVSINSSGKFIGQASGDDIGTLTFDCTYCDVRTDYRALSDRDSSESVSERSSSSGSRASTTSPGAYTPHPISPVYTPEQQRQPTTQPPTQGGRGEIRNGDGTTTTDTPSSEDKATPPSTEEGERKHIDEPLDKGTTDRLSFLESLKEQLAELPLLVVVIPPLGVLFLLLLALYYWLFKR